MNKNSLFSTLSNYLISNEYIHCIFIILEYLCFIFPSCLASTLKLKHFNDTKEQYLQSNPYIDQINIINYYEVFLPEAIHIILLSLILFGLICLIIISITRLSDTKHAFIPQKVIVTLIDIVLFRYFSSLPMGDMANMIVSFLFKDSFAFHALGSFLIMGYFLYGTIGLNYIRTQIVFLNISNPLLIHSSIQHYPYDTLSVYYDLNVFIMKIIISLEYSYFNATLSINYITLALNVIIIILSLLLFAQFSLGHFAFYFKVSSFYANIKQNYLRNIITVFNCSLCLLSLLLFEDMLNAFDIILLFIISINVTIGIIYLEHNDFIQASLQSQSLSYEMIVLMMTKDSKLRSLMFNFKQLQDTVYDNHRKDCKKIPCLLQGIFSSGNYDQNTIEFYKYLSKSKAKETKTPQFKELAKLFYYKLTNKSFKFFRYYYFCRSKYKATNQEFIQQLWHIVTLLEVKEDKHQIDFFDNLIENSVLEKKIETLLENMNTFFNASIQIKKPETVVSLSIELRGVIDKFTALIKKNNQMTNTLVQSNEVKYKAINSVSGYNITIIQFLLENLINHPFSELPPFNAEQNEDYFNVHYNCDNVLVCSKDLLSASMNDLQILKITGDLSRMNKKHYQYLSQLFPNCIKQKGIDLLNDQLKMSNRQQKEFSFPFTSKGVSNIVKYTFGVIEGLKQNIFLTYGQYVRDKKSCLILDFNDPENIEFLSFSNEILEVMKIRRKWLQYLIEKNIRFYLSNLFKECIIKGDNYQLLECEFDSKFFLSNSRNIIEKLKIHFDSISNPLKKEKLKQTIENNANGVQLSFEKIQQYSDTIGLYNVYSNTKNNKAHHLINYLTNNLNSKTEHNELFDDSAMFLNFQSTTSISQAGSGSSLSQTKFSKASKGNSLEALIKSRIKTEAKHLNYYSIMMISLNILIIGICVIFLILQILQSQELLKLNDFFFKFKNIRICVVGDFLSLVSSVCFAEKPGVIEPCTNSNSVYEKYFKEVNGIQDDIQMIKYLKAEVGLKANRCLNTFNQFKSFLFSYKNRRLDTILLKDLQYYEFEDTDKDKIIFTNRTVSLEEGIKQFFNTMFFLSKENNLYTSKPIYLITYHKGIYSFETVPKSDLSLVQMEIYKGLFNFINFYVAFDEVESDLSNQINTLNRNNIVMTISIMITIALLNLILCFLCKQLLSKAYFLFKVLIFNIMTQFEDNKEFAKHMSTKIDAFIILVKFYKQNPNDLIKKIEKSHTSYHKERRAHIGHDNNIHAMKTNTTTIPVDGVIVDRNTRQRKALSFGSDFYNYLFNKLIVTLVLIFIFFFVILVVFDLVLSGSFQKTINTCVYAALLYKFENRIYNIFALSTLARIGNFSDDNVAFVLQEEKGFDGVFNEFLRVSSNELREISFFTSRDPETYPSIADKARYDCNYIFIDVNDSYIHELSIRIGYDYNKLATSVCNSFNLLSQPDFNFLFNDLVLRNQHIINQSVGNDYSSLHSAVNSIKFHDLSMIYLFSMRPLFSFFRWSVLIPLVSSNFNTYITLVCILLCVNIVLETLLFIIVKWLVINKILSIQNNLYLLNNCLG